MFIDFHTCTHTHTQGRNISLCNFNISPFNKGKNSVPYTIISHTVGVDCERLVSKEHIFEYYVSHSDLISATQFVMSRVPPLENHTPCPTQLISMCSRMSRVTQYLSDTLLDELARYEP